MRASSVIVMLCTILVGACESVPLDASATSSVQSGGVTSTESPNWCGYAVPLRGITGIRADWIQPKVHGAAGAQMVAWIGIGGWDDTYNNIVQIGTSAYVNHSAIIYAAWYETLPPNRIQYISSFVMQPGDQIGAEIDLVQTRPQAWRMTLRDASQHAQPLVVTKAFTSLQAYADVIVEDPDATSNNGPPYTPFPTFAPVTFTHAAVRYTNSWLALATVPTLAITLQQNNVVLASPSGFNGSDAFSCTAQ